MRADCASNRANAEYIALMKQSRDLNNAVRALEKELRVEMDVLGSISDGDAERFARQQAIVKEATAKLSKVRSNLGNVNARQDALSRRIARLKEDVHAKQADLNAGARV
eukprot:Opistho-2@15613